jgi:DNA-directed RNA polymerase specialized sigma subunit
MLAVEKLIVGAENLKKKHKEISDLIFFKEHTFKPEIKRVAS